MTELKPRIVVIGVGGAGGNAVDNMIESNLQGVEFYVANTDAQAMTRSKTQNRLQLGLETTGGLGAGAKPEIGEASAEESLEDINEVLDGAHMVFVAAGMGGGTGTGAAPVIARAAHDRGILTIGVITKPFSFEGTHRMKTADGGIDKMKEAVDTLIVVPNQNLFRIANERTTFSEAFRMADDVLYCGVKGITDLMIMPGLINLDFADVRTIMKGMGTAMMGMGEGEGEGGEGEGGVSISAANTDPVVYNAALAITEAHIIAARDAHALGKTDAAAEMFAHPVSEVLFDMEEVFVARGVEDFSDMLTEASLAVINGADADEVATKSDAIIATLRAAAEKAPDNGQTVTEIGAGVAADQIERAADMYRVAAGDEAYAPYLDGYGFYKAGEAAFEQVSADLATSDPESATAITAALALLSEAYPSAVRPDSLDADTAALTVAASNVVLAVGN